MAMQLQISEILGKLNELPNDAQRVEWLRQNDSPTLRMLISHAFDPRIAYNLPDGTPPYKPNDAPMQLAEMSLFSATKKLSYLWLIPSNSFLDSATDTQKAELTRLQVIQDECGRAYQTAVADETVADKEIEAAREQIESGKVRLTKAIQSAQFIKQTVAATKLRLSQIDAAVQRGENVIMTTNNEVARRTNTPVNPEGQRLNIPKYRLESLFISLLESVCADEADVLIAVKNKALQTKFKISNELVQQAFPGLVPVAADPNPVILPPVVVEPPLDEDDEPSYMGAGALNPDESIPVAPATEPEPAPKKPGKKRPSRTP